MGKVIVTLLVIGVGLYGLIRWGEKQAEEKRQADKESTANVIAQLEQAKVRQIEDAMLSGMAVSGMSKYQVLKSMGSPEEVKKTSGYTGEQRAALQKMGVFEVLHYYSKDSMVLVDTNGTVVFVTDYKK